MQFEAVICCVWQGSVGESVRQLRFRPVSEMTIPLSRLQEWVALTQAEGSPEL